MKRISSFLLFIIMFNLISCQKCRECQTMQNGVVVYIDDWCNSGPNSKEQLELWEDEYRYVHPGDSVTCRDK